MVRGLLLAALALAATGLPRAQSCPPGGTPLGVGVCLISESPPTDPARLRVTARADSVSVPFDVRTQEVEFEDFSEPGIVARLSIAIYAEWVHIPGTPYYSLEGRSSIILSGPQGAGFQDYYLPPRRIEALPGHLIHGSYAVVGVRSSDNDDEAWETIKANARSSAQRLAQDVYQGVYASLGPALTASVSVSRDTVAVGELADLGVTVSNPWAVSATSVRQIGPFVVTDETGAPADAALEIFGSPDPEEGLAGGRSTTFQYFLRARSAGTYTVEPAYGATWARYYGDTVGAVTACGEPGASACRVVVRDEALAFTWHQDDIPTFRLSFNGPEMTASGEPVVDWRWTFGDGASGSGRAALHRYDDYGPVEVTLTTTDASGASATLTELVEVRRFGIIVEDNGLIDLVPGPDGPLRLTASDLPASVLPLPTVGQAVTGCGGSGVVLEGDPNVLFEGRAVSRVGDDVYVGSDAHGCMNCPHTVRGPIIESSPTLLVNGVPAAVIGGGAVTTGCCGPNMGTLRPDLSPRLAPLEVMESHTRPAGNPAVPETSQLNDVVEMLGGTVAATTALTAEAQAGDTRLDVAGQDGFAVGDTILLVGANQCVEFGTVAGFGSILLAEPLALDFDAATLIVRASPRAFEPPAPVSRDGAPADGPLALRLYPNPTASTVTIPFTVSAAGPVRLSVVDVLGRTVAVLIAGVRAAGDAEVAFDTGRLVAGVYVVRLEVGEAVATRTLTLAR